MNSEPLDLEYIQELIDQVLDDDRDFPGPHELVMALRELQRLRIRELEAPALVWTKEREHQAWLEIYGAMFDNLLNNAQKKEFIISILRGQLANPPEPTQPQERTD